MDVQTTARSSDYSRVKFISRREKGVREYFGWACQVRLLSEATIHRFEYTTPRLRITPNDLEGNKLEKPKIIHFICSPSRASAIMSEVKGDWKPITVYEPIPVHVSSHHQLEPLITVLYI